MHARRIEVCTKQPFFGQKALVYASMLITANICYSEHASDSHFWRKDIGSQPIDFAAASMRVGAILWYHEHARGSIF